MTDKVVIYSDGGSRGNPGPAGIGVVIFDLGGKELKRFGKYLGTATNNHAEYRALIVGLEFALEIGAKTVVCNLDSELVVRQLQGKYKVREEGLKPLAEEALRLTGKFLQVTFNHIPREKNKLADEMVNQALDDAGF